MTKPGRNDPCPCGSGKKYKKCCLASIDLVESQYRRLRQVEAGLIPRLLEHALDTFGGDSIREAWDEFNGDGSYDEDDPDSEEISEDYDPDAPMNVVFMPWFLYNWTTFTLGDDGGSIPEHTTVAESFLAVNERILAPEEMSFLSSTNGCRFTFCEIVEVNPGVGMKQFDLLRRLEFAVIEHAASQTLRRGDIIYCATTTMGQVTSNLATGPYSLRPTLKRDVLELRDWMLAESESDEITDEHLDEYEADVRDLYLDSVDYMLNPQPDLRNTDNDPLLPQKLYFQINSAEQAFHALKDLAEGVDERDLLADAKLEEGSLRSIELPWFGGNEKARKRLAGPILLGNIKIEDREMIVEVNSSERAELIRQLVEERLGNDAAYQTTLIEPLPPLDSLEAQMALAAAAGERATGDSVLDGASPELLASLEERNRQHWEAWFDDSIPALDNLTPREAAKTERGRDLLESLLCEYENHQDHSPDNLFTADIAALRRELGLE
jgi:hypothetical protein